jgi:hypothetical protein
MNRWIVGLAAVVVLIVGGQGQAAIVNVFQGGDFLGTIRPYTGTLTGAANYNAGVPDVINGPTSEFDRGAIFFYDGSDGLNFTVMFNRHGGSAYRHAHLDISVLGSSSDPMVRVADEELDEVSPDFFEGRWTFGETRDGGVIGEIGGIAWTITVDPLLYDGVLSLRAYDPRGSYIDLNLNTDASGTIRFTPVPEPSTFVMCIGFVAMGLVGCGWRKLRRRR